MAKILIVDDERMVGEMLQAVLNRHRHEVYTAVNGKTALDMFRQYQPNITLLDLHMPEMNGIEVLMQIRSIDPQAQVVMLTGGGTDDLETRARRMGVTDFIKKGLPLDVLVDTMRRALQQPVPHLVSSGQGHGKSLGEDPEPLILVVDDEEMIRSLLSQFLTLRGYRVREASSGLEALALADKESPRVVILDMYMPGMNGVEVLRQLRAKDYAGGVVALTASQDERLLREALDLGSVDVLGKPVELNRLELVLQVSLALTEP